MITHSNDNNLINFSINTIDKIIKAKNKAKKIIESCENNIQLDAAKKFIKLYENLTKDIVGASELEIQLLDKRNKL